MKEIKLYFDIIYYFTNNDERDIFNESDIIDDSDLSIFNDLEFLHRLFK